VVNYGDNFLVGAETEQELIALLETLKTAIGRGSHGRLSVTDVSPPRPVGQGIAFLGYFIRIRGGEIYVRPARHNFSKFCCRVGDLLGEGSYAFNLERAHRYASSWLASFALWENRDKICRRIFNRYLGPVLELEPT
jgi:hypothetical protein